MSLTDSQPSQLPDFAHFQSSGGCCWDNNFPSSDSLLHRRDMHYTAAHVPDRKIPQGHPASQTTLQQTSGTSGLSDSQVLRSDGTTEPCLTLESPIGSLDILKIWWIYCSNWWETDASPGLHHDLLHLWVLFLVDKDFVIKPGQVSEVNAFLPIWQVQRIMKVPPQRNRYLELTS